MKIPVVLSGTILTCVLGFGIQMTMSAPIFLICLVLTSCGKSADETPSQVDANPKAIINGQEQSKESIRKPTPPDLSKAKAASIQIVDGEKVNCRGLFAWTGDPGDSIPELPCIWVILSISDRNRAAAESLGVMPNNSYIQLRDGEADTPLGVLPKGKRLWHIKSINPEAAGEEQIFSEYANMLVDNRYDLVEVPDTAEGLIAALKDTDRLVREKSAARLRKTDDSRVVEMFIAVLDDRDSFVRATAVHELGARKDLRAVEPLITLLKDNDFGVRLATIQALMDINDPRAVEPLIAVLKDRESTVRMLTACALGQMKDPRAIEPLMSVLNDPEDDVRTIAQSAIDQIRKSGSSPK